METTSLMAQDTEQVLRQRIAVLESANARSLFWLKIALCPYKDPETQKSAVVSAARWLQSAELPREDQK